jgi:hypothetical protein
MYRLLVVVPAWDPMERMYIHSAKHMADMGRIS